MPINTTTVRQGFWPLGCALIESGALRPRLSVSDVGCPIPVEQSGEVARSPGHVFDTGGEPVLLLAWNSAGSSSKSSVKDLSIGSCGDSDTISRCVGTRQASA